MARANVNYGGVATVAPQAGGGDYLTPRAGADDFGAQVGQATQRVGAVGENLGAKGMEVATEAAEQATQAKVNDVIANKWAPATSDLRSGFDTMQGIDKIKGYDGYIQGLNKTKAAILETSSSDYEKSLLGSYFDKHIAQETESAKRELAPAIVKYENDAHANFILTQAGNAINNYNNPAVVDSTFKSMDGSIQLQGAQRNMPPEAIEEQQRIAKGTAAVGMIGRATAAGDIGTANALYDQYKTIIPGYQQTQIEKTLHFENIRQNSATKVDAILAGKPMPPSVGAPPAQVQAAVVRAADTNGIDPNHALTVARIESNYGQNVGTRGDIGQTGKGGELPEQAHNMTVELKKSQDVAQAALGRAPEGWESYLCYQQGAGGGPALIKASTENPTARAVDVLTHLYKNPKDALDAVVNNGGNASMTSAQFMDFIKEKYNSNAERAKCTLPPSQEVAVQNPTSPTDVNYDNMDTKLTPEQETQFQEWKAKNAPNDSGKDYDLRGAFLKGYTPSPENGHFPDEFKKPNHPTFSDQSKFAKDYPDLAGHWNGETYIPPVKKSALADSIEAPHAQNGIAVQPAATPVQALRNFEQVYPDALARAQAIPNVAEREGVIASLNAKHSTYSAASAAWTSHFQDQAQTLANNPEFKSLDQIPADMKAGLVDSPETLHYLRERAQYNLDNASGIVSKDQQAYGSKFYDAFRAIHSAPDAPGRITDITQLQKMVGSDLTIAGYDKLVGELQGKGTPEGTAEGDMKKAFFSAAKAQISGRNDMLGIKDPRGEQLFANFMTYALPAYDKGRAEGKTPTQLLNEDSPDYVGKAIPRFKRNLNQMTADMMNDFGEQAGEERTLANIIKDVQSGKITKDAGKAEAQKLGLVKPDSAVPRPE